jgi:hypothetical protein
MMKRTIALLFGAALLVSVGLTTSACGHHRHHHKHKEGSCCAEKQACCEHMGTEKCCKHQQGEAESQPAEE